MKVNKRMEKLRNSELNVDVEDSARNQPKRLVMAISGIALVFALFGIWSNSFGMLGGMEKGGYFLAFLLSLVFLIKPTIVKGKRIIWLDIMLAGLGAFAGFYTVFTSDRLAESNLAASQIDYIMAAIALLLVVEASRRCIGGIMATLPVIFALYALFGNLIPGPLGHFGFTLERFLLRMYMVDEGIYGITTQVASSYIFLFILFGALLEKGGVGELFTDLSNKIAGSQVGGPAKVATISSGLMGSISGSAAANVATTGAFTIPMMKKIGFKPATAGAIEAVASTGGMIMPPIMGAAAFLMAQYLNVGYNKIMIAALIPAFLYYVSVFAWVHFYSLSIGLRGIDKSKLPPIHNFNRRIILLTPLVAIIAALLWGYTSIYAAFIGMIVTVIVGYIQTDRLTVKKIGQALIDGTKGAMPALLACVAAGVIVGVTAMTGLGQVITHNITVLAGDNLFLALVLTAIASLILSMGLPATACYIIVATMIAPALVSMGAMPIAAHMFVFYFACLSNITIPVAIASYTAAGIADAKPFDVGWKSMKIAAVGFIIPFLFVYNPILLAQNVTFSSLTMALITAIAGVIIMAIGGAGFSFRKSPWYFRVGYVGSALLLIIPGWETDLLGFIIAGLILFLEYLPVKREKKKNPDVFSA